MAIIYDHTFDMGAELSACMAAINGETSITSKGISATGISQSAITLALDGGSFDIQLAAQSAVVRYQPATNANTIGTAGVTYTTGYMRIVTTSDSVYFIYADTNPTTSAVHMSTIIAITQDTQGNKFIVYCDNGTPNYFYVLPWAYAGVYTDVPKISPLTETTGFPQCCVYNVPSPSAVEAYLADVLACSTIADNIVCGNIQIADGSYICCARHAADTSGRMAFVMLNIA